MQHPVETSITRSFPLHFVALPAKSLKLLISIINT